VAVTVSELFAVAAFLPRFLLTIRRVSGALIKPRKGQDQHSKNPKRPGGGKNSSFKGKMWVWLALLMLQKEHE